MVSERPRGDSSPTPESGGWEYCVLHYNTQFTDIEYYGVNFRSFSWGPKEFEKIIKQEQSGGKVKHDPLGDYYQGKFLERWKENRFGFGLADALNILAEDNWEIVTSSGFRGTGHIIFKKPKGASPELPTPSQE